VPWYCGFTPGALEKFKAATGREDYRDFFQFPWKWLTLPRREAASQAPDPGDFLKYYEDIEDVQESWIDDFGVLRVPGSMYHFRHIVAPLRNITSAKGVEGYPWPDLPPVYTQAEIDGLRRQADDLKAAGWALMGACGAIFEPAWALRGLDNILVDMMIGSDISAAILDYFTERCLRSARASALAGCDTIDAGDDVGMQDRMMMSPDLWRRTIKPRAAKVFAAARRIKPDIHINYHSDGYIEPIIPDLIEIGADILNPVQPECMDQEKIKRQYGDRLCLERCIGTQTVLPFSAPAEIEAQVKWTIEVLGAGGGLIIGPTHTIEPDVPWENFVAFYRAVLKYGGYEKYPGDVPVL